jgi:hypothetical protein
VAGEDAKGALRVGRLAALAERELEREDGDGREADALRGQADSPEPPDPLAERRAPRRYVGRAMSGVVSECAS